MAFEIPSDWRNYVTEVRGKDIIAHKAADFSLEDKTTHTQEILNAYILEKLQFYNVTVKTDGRLWEYFKEHFNGWTSTFFHTASAEVRGELRDYLRSHGVFVNHRKRMDYALHDTLLEVEQHEWTPEELVKVKRDGNFVSAVYKDLTENVTTKYAPIALRTEPFQQQQIQHGRSEDKTTGVQVSRPTKDENLDAPKTLGLKLNDSLISQSNDGTYKDIADQVLKTKIHNNSEMVSSFNYQLQYGNPQDPATARQLAELSKIYYDETKKFGGNLFDILDTKLRVFFDQCRKVGLPIEHLPTAYSTMLKGRAADFYYAYLSGKGYDFVKLVQATKDHFETEHNRQEYLSLWRETTFFHIINKNPDKDRSECLEILFNTLSKIQQGLSLVYQEQHSLRDQVLNACRGIHECKMALMKPAPTYEGVCADLRSAISNEAKCRETLQFFNSNRGDMNDNEVNWTDRTYGGRSRDYNEDKNKFQQNIRGSHQGYFRKNYPESYRKSQNSRQKKCFICQKLGCWSTRHSAEERNKAATKWQHTAISTGRLATPDAYQSFLTHCEGIECWPDNDPIDEMEQLMAEIEIENYEEFDTFFTEFGVLDGPTTICILNDHSVLHAFTRHNLYDTTSYSDPRVSSEVFTFNNRYSSEKFQGIMPDSGAAGVSTAGQPQFQALQKIMPSLQLDKSTAGEHKIRFGKGNATSLGKIIVPTPFGDIPFHVVPTNTPFLLCINDMDRLGIKFDNIKNVLKQGKLRCAVTRKWGHPWLLLGIQPEAQETNVAWSNLTETELRRIHRRFGHPSVKRLHKVLTRSSHEFDGSILKRISKYCHQCQMNQKSPGRFKFSLKEDFNFNAEIIIDIMHLDGRNVVHVVDSATAFQAARFVKDISTKTVWEAIRLCWIDVYQGPPDRIVHDAGTQFASDEFKLEARVVGSKTKEVPIETHQSVGKVERYHGPLRRAYEVIKGDLPTISRESTLQMAVKAINDTAGPNGLVPTLLVFGAFPRLAEESLPSPKITQRAEAIQKAMKEVKRLYAQQIVKDALRMRNGPDIEPVLNLPLQSLVRVWREKKGWKGPFKLLSTKGQTCTIEMPRGPRNFRSTVVRPYLEEEVRLIPELGEIDAGYETDENTLSPPPSSNNKEINTIKPQQHKMITRGRGGPNKITNFVQSDEIDTYLCSFEDNSDMLMVYLSAKEKSDMELAIKLRKEGKITTPGKPFHQADNLEIEGLLATGVFKFEKFDPNKHRNHRIFNARMVREIKGKGSNTPYEKSRLVIQGYNDVNKKTILTQSPTIQRSSQRVLVALTPSLRHINLELWTRDITQAYIQSQSTLTRVIYSHLPKEMCHNYPKGTIMRLLKPLYGIAEAGLHWFATYFKHHQEKLKMKTSTYDPCFLVTDSDEQFAIVGMQTDDTLILADEKWSKLEETELAKAGFRAKPKSKLTPTTPLDFNGCTMTLEENNVVLRQKEQGKRLQIIDFNSPEMRQHYTEQRARAAYIASICQPEATFDMSVAAQHHNPEKDDVTTINKRIRWQMNNITRGLTYIPLDLSEGKLFVFVDGSFANNKDLSSQIGFVVVIANEQLGKEEFMIRGNLLHWSSTKSKRVTRSSLASEILAMVGGVDIGIAIWSTLQIISKKLSIPEIPLIVCTDSYSLYECLVKLGSTSEKRLMVDIMHLRQSYERREISEIRWVNGQDNPADAMTKASPNKALETFINTNSLTIRIEGWVNRTT